MPDADVMLNLHRGRDLAWATLKPAFELAINEAEQAEYEANRLSNIAMTSVLPTYPPWVLRLARAGAAAEPSGPRQCGVFNAEKRCTREAGHSGSHRRVQPDGRVVVFGGEPS